MGAAAASAAAAAPSTAAAAEAAAPPPPTPTPPTLLARLLLPTSPPRRRLLLLPSALPLLRYDDSDLVIRALEPLAVLLTVGLVAAAVAYYSAAVTPLIFSRVGWGAGLCHTAFGLSLCYAFGRSYWHLLTTPPRTTRDVGRARLEQEARRAATAEAEATAENDEEKFESPYCWRHCDRCDLPKPPLAHHCSVCKACVLRADHHCVFFANCLGFGNYRHFALFLVYLSAGSAYACVTTYALHHEAAARDPWTHRWLVVLALASGGVALALGALLAWHAACLATGLGTLEMMDRVFGWHEEDEEEDDDEEGEEEEKEGGGGVRRRQREPAEARQRPSGRRPRPPHVAVASLREYPWNLGLEANVRLAFDLEEDGGRGLPWWLRWLRVHGAPRKGDGVVFPTHLRQSTAAGKKKS